MRYAYRGHTTHWVWDGNTLHEWTAPEETGDTTSEVVTWLFEHNGFAPLAKLTAGSSYSVIADHLGTPLALYDGQGQATWEMSLDSYGAVRQGKGQAQDCPFRYQGQYEDVETGLYYNRFRYYDPESGHLYLPRPHWAVGGYSFLWIC